MKTKTHGHDEPQTKYFLLVFYLWLNKSEGIRRVQRIKIILGTVAYKPRENVKLEKHCVKSLNKWSVLIKSSVNNMESGDNKESTK